MTNANSFSNKKLLVTHEYSGTERFLIQYVVRGSGYSIGPKTAEQTPYGNNWVTWMQVIMDPPIPTAQNTDMFGHYTFTQCLGSRFCQLPPHPVAYPGTLFGGGFNKYSWGHREWGSGGGIPLVRGSGGSCNLVQEISFHIVKFS